MTKAKRSIQRDGRNLVVRTYPELADAVTRGYKGTARRARKAGEAIPPGEQKGHSHALGRLLCWLMSLSDADRERIDREGAPLWAQLEALDPDYEGPLPFGRREGSVFAPEPAGPGESAPPSAGRGWVPRHKHLGGGGGNEGQDVGRRRRKREQAGAR